MIRIILADDHHLVRQGIRALLDKAHDMEVVGEAADGQDAITLTRELHPDVLVMDIAMPRLSGNQAVEHIHAAGMPAKVVILSIHSDEMLVRQTLRHGASGYLLKGAVKEELLLAIRAAARGEIYLSPSLSNSVVTGYLASEHDADLSSPFERLTPREREVLQLVCEGHTNNGVAQILGISAKTVEKHRANVMTKLDVHNLAELVRTAIRYGLVFIDK